MDNTIIRNVVIQEKIYSIYNHDFLGSGYSGSVYRLQTDSIDLAVKIYRQKVLDFCEKESSWFPCRETLQYFVEQSHEFYPVLLSHYLVEDMLGNYIGCASPYVEEINGKTVNCIWQLATDQFFTYFENLWKTISHFTSKEIEIEDWNADNIILGRGRDLPFDLYMIDDSSYKRSPHPSFNQDEMNNLLEDVITSSPYSPLVIEKVLMEFQKHGNILSYLEKRCQGYCRIGDLMEDYSDCLKKKRY